MAKGRWRGVGGQPQILAVGVYFVVTAVYLIIAPLSHFREHTAFNHFALLAQSWLEHRLDLGQLPPSYAGGNDFALFEGRWYVVFPPVPALLITPLVYVAGGAEHTPDGVFFTLLAGLGPTGMLLTLERARRDGWSKLTRTGSVALAMSYAFGTVYFFTAVQGTVWFAAHVVAAAGTTFFLYHALGARDPLRAGIALALAVGTRPILIALGLFFLMEWYRTQHCSDASPTPNARVARAARQKSGRLLAPLRGAATPPRPSWFCRGFTPNPAPALRPPSAAMESQQLPASGTRRNRRALGTARWQSLAVFALPVGLCLLLLAWLNQARFGDPFEFGYRYLAIAWQSRIEKWGLFSYHYLARNLALLLTSLPYLVHGRQGWLLQINGHGLALWVTTPLYLCLLWPRQKTPVHRELYVTLSLIMLPSLLYQNSGWVQFGQRFSNDYAPLLILLLAIGGHVWSRFTKTVGVAAVGINLFGALTFGRPESARFYFIEPSQRVIFQPD